MFEGRPKLGAKPRVSDPWTLAVGGRCSRTAHVFWQVESKILNVFDLFPGELHPVRGTREDRNPSVSEV